MKTRKGISMSEKEKAEWEKVFKDIEECIKYIMKSGKNI